MNRYEIPESWDLRKAEIQLRIKKRKKTFLYVVGGGFIALAMLKGVNGDNVVIDSLLGVYASYLLHITSNEIDAIKKFIRYRNGQ
jgi:hypothetical protein